MSETATENAKSFLPSLSTVRRDGIAGATVAISSVPDGMASGLLAGVNPIYGLYANVAGPIVGGLLTNTALMVVCTTSAAALVSSQALAGTPQQGRDEAFFLMVIIAGLMQVLFGLLKLGRLIRFVSHSVMTGFVAGIALVLFLSQLPAVTGYQAAGDNRITQTIDLLRNLGQIDPATFGIAVLTLGLAVALPRSPLRKVASLTALLVPTLLVIIFGLESVRTVRDVGEIPSGFPVPALPAFSEISLEVITGALAVSVIVLVQGAGVSQSVSEAGSGSGGTSRDFIAQGAGNVASGLIRGIPVGGSLSASALNAESGARGRGAAIFAGVCILLILLFFAEYVAWVAMPALSGLLIYAAASSVQPSDIETVWIAGWTSVIAAAVTLVATVVLPIQIAVALGITLSVLLTIFSASTNVSLVELKRHPDGRVERTDPPKSVEGGKITVLDIYGHLFFAGAYTLGRILPEPGEGRNPVVLLRLQSRTDLDATLIEVLEEYAKTLADADGRLYLVGLSDKSHEQVMQSDLTTKDGPVKAYKATDFIGEATDEAYEDARAWLESKQGSEKK